MLVGYWLPWKEGAREGEQGGRYVGKEDSHGRRFVQNDVLLKKQFDSLSHTLFPQEQAIQMNSPTNHKDILGSPALPN